MLLLHLVEQAIRRGSGLLLVDVKGDLVPDVLARIPKERRDDVVVLDPASGLAQPGLRIFGRSSDPDLTADLLVGTFKELFPDSHGIRLAGYLRLGAQTLARTPGATLLELPLLFADAARRRRIVGALTDPLLKASWARFEALSSAEQATHLMPLLTRLDEVLSRPAMRVVLGQPSPKLAWPAVLARRHIVLVRAPRGVLGEAAARLLTSLVIWQAFSAVLARAELDPGAAACLSSSSTKQAPWADFPATGRHPRAGSWPSGRRHDRAAERLSAAAARAGRCGPERRDHLRAAPAGPKGGTRPGRASAGVSPEELQSLGQYEIALRLGLGPGSVSPVMTGRTAPPTTPISDPKALAQYAASRWGSTLAEVDAHYAASLRGTPAPKASPRAQDQADRRRPGRAGGRHEGH